MSQHGILYAGEFDWNDWRYLGDAGQDTLKAAAATAERRRTVEGETGGREGRTYCLFLAASIRPHCMNLQYPDVPLPRSSLLRRLRHGTIRALLAPPPASPYVWIRADAVDWCRAQFHIEPAEAAA